MMNFGNLRSRIDELERTTPGAVTFYSPNGGKLEVPGGALSVYNAAMEQIRQGSGPLYRAVCEAERAENFGLFLEVLKALVN